MHIVKIFNKSYLACIGIMFFGKSNDSCRNNANGVIVVNGMSLERVCKYKYLGTWLTEDWDNQTEVKTRYKVI